MASARTILAWLAPVFGLLAFYVSKDHLEVTQAKLLGIFVATVISWLAEKVPLAVTALLIAPALVITQVATSSEAFAPYADPLLYLFVGGFMLAKAMQKHGVDKAIAAAILSRSQGPQMTFAALIALGAFFSMWMSNTATAAMLIPIAMQLYPKPRDRASVVLTLAYACSIGGLGSLVGSPPNGIAVRALDGAMPGSFGFIEWLGYGLPLSMVLLIVLFFYMRGDFEAQGSFEDDTRMTSGGWLVLGIVACAVVLWALPGILSLRGIDTLKRFLPSSTVAVLAAGLLFVLPSGKEFGGRPLLEWREASTIDWGIIILFGGGISLGDQMMKTGLAQYLSDAFISSTGLTSVALLTAVFVIFTVFFTEVCSNTASASMLAPIAVTSAISLDASPVGPVMGIALAASCAFMLPIATGPNALAYSSGTVSTKLMLRKGLWLNLICAVVTIVWLHLV